MKNAKERIQRKGVSANVRENYDPCKDFFQSFFRAYLVEAALEFFGMCDRDASPTKHVIPPGLGATETSDWIHETLREFIDTMVLPRWSKKPQEEEQFRREYF